MPAKKDTTILDALTAGFTVPVSRETPSGCGRVYVVVCDEDKAKVKAVRAAAKKLGKIFQTRSHYGDRNALYVGYDNCTGYELARGTAVVEALKAVGVTSYRNEHGD